MSETITYQLLTGTDSVKRLPDGAFIPPDPANRDWQMFLEWVAAGNTPLPAPGSIAPPIVTLPQPTTLEADPEGDMDATTKRYVDEQIATLQQQLRRV